MSAGTILLVEDNPITRKMLRVTLELEGYQVLDTGEGKAALEIAAARQPDLLILDYVLPDIDGLALLAQLREQSGAREVPVILITGMVSRLEELRVRAGGAQLLPKPVEPSQLLDLVRAQLAPTATRATGQTILVVDDEPLNLKLAVFRLRRAGYQVETASGGEAALTWLRGRRPDAILSDVMMPSMDGFTFCREARRDPALGGIPIILVSSAYVDEADRDLARQMGANALVVRTPDLHDAMSALNAALQGNAAAPPTATGDQGSALHRERLQVQLERQNSRNETLLRQAAIQATALSVIRGLSEVLAQPRDVTEILGDVLVHCLDAAGLSTGLLYMTEPGGEHRLQAQFGVQAERRADAEGLFGHPELIRRIVESRVPVALSARDAGAEIRDFVSRLGHSSVLILPFVVLGETFGELVLASDDHDLSEEAWIGFARSLGLQFGQTVALGQSLKRLATSESRYRALMENASDAILILDPAATVLEVNRETERLLGRGRDQIIGRRYEEFVAPEERADSERLQGQLLVDRALRVESRQMTRADGSAVAVEVSASLIQVGDEAVGLTIMRDITERQRAERDRRRAEMALRAAQDRLQHVLSSSPAVLYTLFVEGDHLVPRWTSANIERLSGFTPEEVGRDLWLQRIHPDDRERVTAEALDVLGEGSGVREYRFRHRDGGYRWIRDEQILIHHTGEADEVVGSWFDITARKEAESKLHESEEQYRMLFDHNPSPMWVFDVESLAFLAVNDAAVSHYGWTREEFLRMRLTEIRPPEVVPAFLQDIEELRDRPARHNRSVWRHCKKDGTEIDVEVAATSITFQGRRARLTMATDVTERTMLQAQLLRAQKMEAVGQLAGGIAHDFNNLLGVITGYSELLIKSAPANSRELRRGEEIKAAADRAAALTRQLLAFSRRQILQPTVLDLSAVVGDVEKMLRRVISESIQIVTKSAADLGRVRADAGQLEQVIMNLAVNARDAMPAGGRLLIETANVELDEAYVRTRPEARPGDYVLLAVSDTGHGMDAKTTARIFEPFFTTKEEGKGTGLGLATVYGIVRQSGGLIDVYSEPGQGTRFQVYLPRVEQPAEVKPRVVVEAPPGGTETVLVVEDAEALRQLVRELLEGAGYTVLDADGPEQALALAQSTPGPIDLVITDLVMPYMSGQDLAARLAELRPHTRTVFMSGYSERAINDQGTLAPGTNFLQKPFTMDALLRTTRRALDG